MKSNERKGKGLKKKKGTEIKKFGTCKKQNIRIFEGSNLIVKGFNNSC